jgi:catechol 2,3-dioxygenase-like lactoylglutathione lyase family enzyme
MKLSELAFFTDDVAAMAAFYRGLLGKAAAYEAPDMAVFDQDGLKILIHRVYSPGPQDLPPENHVAFVVDDLEAACSALGAAGLEVEVGPQAYDWGRSAYLRDPDGHLVELQESE